MEKWYEAYADIEPSVVKIITPRGSGTGFMIAAADNSDIIAIATAYHVIHEAHYWYQPLRIHHYKSNETLFLDPSKRVINIWPALDLASISFRVGQVPFPLVPHQLIPEAKRLNIGVEIGWVGFPAISQNKLCFFSGTISSWDDEEKYYLVDGVAINGVSGGPTFFIEDGNLRMVGVVSAYIPNQANGISLPGLCMVRDINPLYGTVKQVKDFNDAKKRESQSAIPPPPSMNEGA